MRDFFYNKGDIFIAVIIILAAAVVIYIRVGIVLDYSEKGGKGSGLLPELPFFGSGGDDGDGPDKGTEPPAQGGQDGQGGQAVAPPDGGQNPSGGDGAQSQAPGGQNPPPGTQDPPPQSTPQSIQIIISAGDAASTIADKLLAAGAITDKQAFLSEVMAQGADSKLKIGTFTIPIGSSNSEIIAILVG